MEEDKTLILSEEDDNSEGKTMVDEEAKTLVDIEITSEEGWQKGQVINNLYRIDDITKGGMGAIYFVNHLKWGIKLVVKLPLKELLKGENRERFIREAEAWVALGKHPNIATAFYVREIQGIPGIFIEFADGGSLSSWLKQNRKGDITKLLDMAIQFCGGMIHAHSKDFIHRDIKPDNVLLMQDGTVKITDFGLVKSKGDSSSKKEIKDYTPPVSVASEEWQTITQAKAIGTPPYMPPEQWTDADKADKRADIYSFGIMLFEMICGRRPFILEDDNPYPPIIAYQVMHRFNPPPDPCQFRNDIPEKLKELILKCMSKEIHARFTSFEEIQDKLIQIYNDISQKDYERTFPGEAELKAEDLNNRALSYIDIGKKKEAKKLLEEAIKIDPHSLYANINLIILLTDEKLDSYENIKLRFKSLKESNNQSPFPYYYEALFEFEHGKSTESITLIDKALEMDKYNPLYWNLKGVILNSLKRYNEGLEAFKKSLDYDRQNSEQIRNLGGTLYYLERYKESCDEFEKILKSFPGKDIKLDLAVSLTGKGENEKALSIFKEFLEENKNSIKGNIYMGEFLAGTTDFIQTFPSFTEKREEGELYIKKALSLSPHNPRIIDIYRKYYQIYARNKLTDIETPVLPEKIKKEERELISAEISTIRTIDTKGGKITGVAISSDNSTAFSTNTDSIIEMWDLVIVGHIKKFSHEELSMKFESLSLDISPCNKYIISAHGDGTLRMWDIKSGEATRTFYGHTNIVRNVRFSPDGNIIASGGADGTVNIWERDSGFCRKTLSLNGGNIYTVRFSPDGKYIAAGIQKKEIQLWDINTGEVLKYLRGHTGSVLSLSFSPDGKYILSGSDDKTMRLWDIEKENCIRVFSGHLSSIEALDFSPYAYQAVSGSGDGVIKLWDISTGECTKTIIEHNQSITDIKFSADGRAIISGSKDRTIKYIKLNIKSDITYPGRYRKEYLITKPRTVKESIQDEETFRSILFEGEKNLREKQWQKAYSLFRKGLEISGYGKDRRAFKGIQKAGKEGGSREGVKSFWLLKLYPEDIGPIDNVHISESNNLIVYTGNDNIIRVRNFEDNEIKLLEGHKGRIVKIAVSHNDDFLISGSEDKTMKLWDLTSGQCLKSFSSQSEFRSLNLLENSKYIVSGGSITDSSIRLMNTETGEIVRDFQGHSSSVGAVKLSSDNKYLLSCSDDKSLKLWDIVNGKCIRNFLGHTLPVNDCDISFDGKSAVSGGQDKNIKLWDIESEKCLKTMKDHNSSVTSVAFSPDGRFIISAGGDNTIKLWNKKGELLRTLEGHTDEVRDIKISSGGRYIISGSKDGTVRLWEIDWEWKFNDTNYNITKEIPKKIPSEQLVLERKEEIKQDTTYYTVQKSDRNVKTIISLIVLTVIIAIVIMIPSCIKDISTGRAKTILKIMGRNYSIDNRAFDLNCSNLVNMGDVAVEVVVKEGLDNKSGLTQLMSFKILDRFPNRDYVKSQATKELIKLLDDKKPAIRGEAALYLAKLKSKEALPDMLKALEKEKTRWSDIEKELIENSKKRQPYYNSKYNQNQSAGYYYECSSCHGEIDIGEGYCSKMRIRPWEYTQKTMEDAVNQLTK